MKLWIKRRTVDCIFNETQTGPMENSTECIPVREYFAQIAIDTIPAQAVFGLCYSMVWLAAVTSNLLVLIVVFVIICNGGKDRRNFGHGGYHRPRLSSAISASSFSVRIVFVVSLACSDLLTSLTSLPVTAVNILTHVWPFPYYMCHCIGFFQGFSIFQSSFTFTSIAVDRYLLVFYPDHAVVTYRAARCGIAVLALVAAVLASPMFIFVDVMRIEPVCGVFCVERWPENSMFFKQRIYGLFVISLQFGVPALVTAICYLRIANRLRYRCGRSSIAAELENKINTPLKSWKNRWTRRGSAGAKEASRRLIPSAERRSNERRRRANRMMAAMVTAFTILWLPFNALNIMRDFDLFELVFKRESFSLLYASAHLVAMSTLIWNPLIYAWFNKSLRAAVTSVFQCHEVKRS